MSLLKVWLAGTALLVGGALVWAFVPILVPAALVLVALGGLVALVVRLARAYERRRAGGPAQN